MWAVSPHGLQTFLLGLPSGPGLSHGSALRPMRQGRPLSEGLPGWRVILPGQAPKVIIEEPSAKASVHGCLRFFRYRRTVRAAVPAPSLEAALTKATAA
jgi:hypothetical protein